MSAFLNARSALTRWLSGGDKVSPTQEPRERRSNGLDAAGDRDEHIAAFLDELRASSQDWLGRVRLINFDTIRERLGPSWPKLQSKVELLTEKIFREEMSRRDRYLNIGSAEFLVFIADASPEEVRIRCLAIVETIQEKLFGIGGDLGNPTRRIAETHVAHKEDLALLWEDAASAGASGGSSPTKALRGLFRRDAETLDGADIATSAQIVIDLLISRAMESRSLGDLAPILERLRHLDGSLAVLEPALAASGKPVASSQAADAPPRAEFKAAAGEQTDTPGPFLNDVRDDAAQLVRALAVDPHRSHAEVLGALARLQSARAERNAKNPSDQETAAPLAADKVQTRKFEFCPVYRCVSRGEQIYQGIFRVGCVAVPGEDEGLMQGGGSRYHPESAAMERLLLEHAIQYWADHRTAARFILMVPVHVETLHGPMSQRRYSTVLRAADLRTRRRLVVEVTGYRELDNTIGIRRAIDELRTQSHAVFVRLSGDCVGSLPQVAADCKKAGVHAIGLDIAELGGPEAAIIPYLAPLAAVGRGLSISTYVSGISSVPVLAKAVALDISYVCAPALLPPRPAPREVERTSLADLYSAV
jgi:hypothetical protein